MEQRRATYRAAIRMAAALSVAAVVLSVVLESITDVSRPALMLVVIVVGFASSWALTTWVAESVNPRAQRVHASREHRVTVLPARHSIA